MRLLLLLWALNQLKFANENVLTGPRPRAHPSPLPVPGCAPSPHNASVAIIGAGFAGLSAHRRLRQLGFTNVHIFEGSNRLGGRVFPEEYDGIFLQHGAEFINGRQNKIYAMARRLGLLVDEVGDAHLLQALAGDARLAAVPGCAVPPDKLRARFAQFSAHLEARYARLAARAPASNWNVTIGALFQKDYAAFLKDESATRSDDKRHFDSLARAYAAYYEGEWAAPIDKLALHNYAVWQDQPGASSYTSFSSYTLDARGYARILQELIDQQGPIRPDRLHLATRLMNIDYGHGNGIRLRIRDGNSSADRDWPELFDHVIVTVPLGHLKRYASALFTPPLPASKRRVIRALGFGTVQKIFLVYERPFWPANTSSLITLSCDHGNGDNHNYSVTTALRTIQPHPWKGNILVIWLSGDGPRLVNALDDAQLGTLVTEHLRVVLPDLEKVPEPRHIIRKRWADDELFLGSYSFITPEVSALSRDPFAFFARPVRDGRGVPRVLFAGEATESRMFQTVPGAYRSGRREAARLAEYLEQKKCAENGG